MRVSEIRVKRIRVNQGLGVQDQIARQFIEVKIKQNGRKPFKKSF